MKRIVLTIIIVLSCIFTIAQIPESFNYQAIPRDANGGVYPEQQMNIRISILIGSTSGSSVYTETFSQTTTSLGLLNLQIGKGIPVSGNFTTISWGTNLYYLKVEIDPSGGTTFADIGTTQLLSVPYALFSKTSGEMNNITVSNSGDTLSIGTTKIIIPGLSAANAPTVIDIDGNIYKTITIGTQVWMKENLKTTKYNDGTEIPNITDNSAWEGLTTGAYSDYNNTPSNSTTYGRLYNWYAIDNNASTRLASNGGKNVCPIAWHVPSDAEWTTLTTYLTNNGYGYGGSGDDIAKSMVATSGWSASGTLGDVGNDQASNNNSGFTALPSGYRNGGGLFDYIGNLCGWWSSTQGSTSIAYLLYLSYDSTFVVRGGSDKVGGFSVRCLQD
jgi:uncharacterized protein (TIGR02145 family)